MLRAECGVAEIEGEAVEVEEQLLLTLLVLLLLQVQLLHNAELINNIAKLILFIFQSIQIVFFGIILKEATDGFETKGYKSR